MMLPHAENEIFLLETEHWTERVNDMVASGMVFTPDWGLILHGRKDPVL